MGRVDNGCDRTREGNMLETVRVRHVQRTGRLSLKMAPPTSFELMPKVLCETLTSCTCQRRGVLSQESDPSSSSRLRSRCGLWLLAEGAAHSKSVLPSVSGENLNCSVIAQFLFLPTSACCCSFNPSAILLYDSNKIQNGITTHSAALKKTR